MLSMRQRVKQYHTMLIALYFTSLLCSAYADVVLDNVVLNGNFAGYPALGIPRHHFWQYATQYECLKEGDRCFLRLLPGKSVRQRVAVYAPLAAQARLHVLVRGTGRVALRGLHGNGTESVSKPTREWQELVVQPCDTKPPYHIVLEATGGVADFTEVRLDAPLPAVSPQQVADRILAETTWAVNESLLLSVDDEGPVQTAFDARRYNVLTGERSAPSRAYICSLDTIPHTLQFLALMTDDPDWKSKFIRVCEDVLRYNVDANGAAVAWNCLEDKPHTEGHYGYSSLIELFLDAARVSGDPKFVPAALKMGDRVRTYAPRPDGGMAWALYPDGRRFDAFAYYQDHIYGMSHPVILGRLFIETSDGRFMSLARRAAAWEMATHQFGKYARPDHIDPWCDDYFGIIVSGICALHQQTSQAEFLAYALEASRQLWPLWVQSLGNGSHTAGDQPRTWDIWCYLARNGGPSAYLEGARVAALQALNYRQDVDTFWKDFNTKDFAPLDVHMGSVPLNLLSGLAAIYGATRDPLDLARYNAVFDSTMTGYKRPHGIMSYLPSPLGPGRALEGWAPPHSSFNLPRFFRICLRMATLCRNVPIAVGQHGFPIMAVPTSDAVRAALRREHPEQEPDPPHLAAWETYWNTPTFTASSQYGYTITLTGEKGTFSYVEDASGSRRWKESVYEVHLSPGAALGWDTYYGVSFPEKCIGLGSAGAKGRSCGSFNCRAQLKP